MSVSRFAFGTASFFNVGTARRRADLLAAAYDHGFTHFDTAPSYGFGTAERDLKPLLSAHPNITVATKVGIYSPGGEAQPAAAVFMRKAAGKIVPTLLSRPTVDWSVARAQCARALAASLITDEWLRWLESERDRVVRFGIAVNLKRLRSFVVANNPLASFIQTLDSIADREADILVEHGRPLQITYGYIRAALRKGPADIPAILAAALRRNSAGSVIVSTRKRERLGRYAEISDAVDKTATSTPADEAQ